MYRRSQSLQTILEIRQEMARQADHDVDLFTELVRSGKFSKSINAGSRKAKDSNAGSRKSSIRKTSKNKIA